MMIQIVVAATGFDRIDAWRYLTKNSLCQSAGISNISPAYFAGVTQYISPS